MTTLQVGSLSFVFNHGVEAAIYDNWTFYRSQFKDRCGRDNAAVDIVAYSKDKRYLIEVKAYSHQAEIPKSDELVNKLVRKYRDTLAGLMAGSVNALEPKEKSFCQKFTRHSGEIRLVLHVELPSSKGELKELKVFLANLRDVLRRILKAIDPHLKVVNKAHFPADLPWHVR